MTHPLTPREKVADRGPAGAVMDALWPILGGDQMDAETWTEISKAVGAALASGSGDHAGLKRIADEAADFGVPAKVDPAVLNALLAEIAALRGERDRAKERMHKAIDKARDEEIAAQNAELRATEAERKLAEAAGLLEVCEASMDAECAGSHRIALNTIRPFLSKEAERG